jgi:hypothetical protein
MTKTRKVNFAITLDAEDYERLEKICAIERRSKSRQIAWIIKHHNTAVSKERERNAIRKTLSENGTIEASLSDLKYLDTLCGYLSITSDRALVSIKNILDISDKEGKEKDKAGGIITPHPSVWGNTATP